MLNRVWLLKTLFFYLDKVIILHKFKVANLVVTLIKKIKQQPVIFFTNTDEIHILNKGIPFFNFPRFNIFEISLRSLRKG